MYIVDSYTAGLGTLTLQLYPRGSDTILNTGGDTAAVNGTKAGYYEWTVSETLVAGTVYDAVVLTAGGVKIGGGEVVAKTGDTRVPITASSSTSQNAIGADLLDGGRLDLLIDAILEDTGTTLDGLVDRIAACAIGNVAGAGTGTEIFTYGGVTATISVNTLGDRTVTFS